MTASIARRDFWLNIISVTGAVGAGALLVKQQLEIWQDGDLVLPLAPQFDPANPTSLFPDISPQRELAHAVMPMSQYAQRDVQARWAKQCFDIAVKNNLLPIMAKVCHLTGMEMSSLLTLAAYESRMGDDLRVNAISDHRKDTKKPNSPRQTAEGIAQIVNGTFYEYAWKHVRKFRVQISDYGGSAGKTMLAALPFLKEYNPLTVNHDIDARLLDQQIARRAKELGPKIPDLKAARRAAEAAVLKIYDDNVKARILAGRNSHFVSMLLASAESISLTASLSPAARSVLKGSETRLFHMFGQGDAKKMLASYMRDPTMTIDAVFGLVGLPRTDEKCNKLVNNRIDGNMKIGDYLHAFAYSWEAASTQFAKSYAEHVKSHPLDPVEVATGVRNGDRNELEPERRLGSSRRGLLTGSKAAPRA